MILSSETFFLKEHSVVNRVSFLRSFHLVQLLLYSVTWKKQNLKEYKGRAAYDDLPVRSSQVILRSTTWLKVAPDPGTKDAPRDHQEISRPGSRVEDTRM